MKLFIFASMLSVLVACNGSGGSSPTAQEQVSPTPAPTPLPATIDYSLISCGSIADCSAVCDVLHPQASAASIKTNVCAPYGLSTTGATCQSLITYHDSTYLPSNQACKGASVAAVMNPAYLGTVTCSSLSGCSARCAGLFPFSGLSCSSGSGAALRACIDSWMVAEQQAACLLAPSGFVMN